MRAVTPVYKVNVWIVLLLVPACSSRTLIPCLGNRVDQNGSDFRYASPQEFASDMCAQCYGYIQSAGVHMREAHVANRTVRFRPLIPYMVNNTGVLCEDRNNCFFVVPDTVNRTHPARDRILKTLTSDFYRVRKQLSHISCHLFDSCFSMTTVTESVAGLL